MKQYIGKNRFERGMFIASMILVAVSMAVSYIIVPDVTLP